ncbi:hypothetical protein [Nocardioides terrisoli]|uniref:hypothetical protein n=1 Tax=Nocardioides terrisoli TaxID=3388267 RepID=UPI00287BC3BC|nr:hypothetical protein [Nocardioides marmorisolisilvae]
MRTRTGAAGLALALGVALVPGLAQAQPSGGSTAGVVVRPSASGRTIGHHRPRVRTVSDPPTEAPRRLLLTVRGTASKVAVYLNSRPGPRGRDALLVTRAVRVRRHKVRVKVPTALRPGGWYVVVCPARTRHRCAASRTTMAKLPGGGHLSPPVRVTTRPEAAQAVTKAIGHRGGTLTTTGADGTKFTLAIAAGSVPDGTAITMTPLASLTGSGWAGKLIGAVQLEPSGLTLVHGGTLTITPVHAVPVAHQVAFGYEAGGSDLGRVPFGPTRAMRIPIAHFSGAGAADDGGTAPPSTGSSIVDFYEILIADVIQDIRSGHLSESSGFDQVQSLLLDALADIKRDEVPPGLSGDAAADQAIKDLLVLARQSQLVGGGESMFENVRPIILKLLEGKWKRAQQRCADNKDLAEIANVVGADRSEQLLGYVGHDLADDYQCARFTVHFDSRATMTGTGGVSGTIQLEYAADPIVRFDSSLTHLTGAAVGGSYKTCSGSVSNADGSYGPSSCTPASFSVQSLVIDNLLGEGGASGGTISVDVGKPSETYTAATALGSRDYQASYWLGCFQNTFVQPFQLTAGSGSTVVTGTSTGDYAKGDLSCSMVTSIDVELTPPAPPR